LSGSLIIGTDLLPTCQVDCCLIHQSQSCISWRQ